MGARRRLTKQHIGRPMDFLGFDGKTYHGRIEAVKRRSWLVFTYYVAGLGDVRNTLDLRKHRDRIVEVY